MANQYIDYCQIKGKSQRVILFVSSLAHVGQPPYGVVYEKPNGALKRVIRGDRLPTTKTFEAAQNCLDVYAIANRLKRISYCEICGSEIVTDPLDNSTNQRFCSTKCMMQKMKPSEICRAYNIQQCHCCDDMDCGDNLQNQTIFGGVGVR